MCWDKDCSQELSDIIRIEVKWKKRLFVWRTRRSIDYVGGFMGC